MDDIRYTIVTKIPGEYKVEIGLADDSRPWNEHASHVLCI